MSFQIHYITNNFVGVKSLSQYHYELLNLYQTIYTSNYFINLWI